MNLNAEQRAVVSARSGAKVCLAVPGAGKTTAIVARVKALLAEGAKPHEILSLSFTSEAAKEMEKRAALKLDKTAPKIFRTFHSFALDFVIKERENFPFKLEKFPLLTPHARGKILGGLLKRYRDVEFHDVSSYISLMKRRGIGPEEAEEEALGDFQIIYARIYLQYEKACREHGQLDFDSVIIESVALLEDSSEVRARWQFKYIQMDEAQDNDAVQWRLVELISEKHGNVLAVGDENQQMYSWRGAEAGGLSSGFEQRFRKAEVLPLSVNYRSTQAIVAYCKEIAPVRNEAIERMVSQAEPGESPEFKYFSGDDNEAASIVRDCNMAEINNMAVLSRTNRQLRAFERACIERNVRYRLLGDSGFWKTEEVKNCMAFVQQVVAPSDVSTKRVIKSPYDCTRFLRKTDTIEHLEAVRDARPDGVKLHQIWATANLNDTRQNEVLHGLAGMFSRLRGQVFSMGAGAALQRILDEANILNYYRDDEHAKQIDNDPVENILDLVKDAKRFQSLYDFYLYARKAANAPDKETGLTLSTVHQAKGKEWGTVFVVGVNDGLMPHKKGDEQEERCIYFVACSRAATKLVVSCNDVPSPYIRHKLPAQLNETPFEMVRHAKQFQSLLELTK